MGKTNSPITVFWNFPLLTPIQKKKPILLLDHSVGISMCYCLSAEIAHLFDNEFSFVTQNYFSRL